MAKTKNPTGNEDINFFRCTRCGFPCDLSRDKQIPGHGYSYTTLTGVTTQTQYPDNWTVKFGCPQCGKGEYTKKM